VPGRGATPIRRRYHPRSRPSGARNGPTSPSCRGRPGRFVRAPRARSQVLHRRSAARFSARCRPRRGRRPLRPLCTA